MFTARYGLSLSNVIPVNLSVQSVKQISKEIFDLAVDPLSNFVTNLNVTSRSAVCYVSS